MAAIMEHLLDAALSAGCRSRKSARVRQAIRGLGGGLSGEALEGMKEARRIGVAQAIRDLRDGKAAVSEQLLRQ
jgi:hypothetical protein